MSNRYVSIWFRYLRTDWFSLREPELKSSPFVLRTPSHGRMIITATNAEAEIRGIKKGMVLADAKAIHPDLIVKDDPPNLAGKLLGRLAEWCIRFTPTVAADPEDGLLLDATGCSHLWGGDENYLEAIVRKLNARGYEARAAMADTIGAAWGIARYGHEPLAIPAGLHLKAMLHLPPEALRLEAGAVERLHKLGLHRVEQFVNLPRAALRRRLGAHFLMRMDMALGQEMETIQPIYPEEPYQERLPCLEVIVTATGIAIALEQLLEKLCHRLRKNQLGIRQVVFKCYRVDGKVEQAQVSTNRPSYHVQHLLKLFEGKISTLEPALGIELFILEAPKVEDHLPVQERIWNSATGLDDIRLAELVDRLTMRIGPDAVLRYMPAEHYWPERSYYATHSMVEEPQAAWAENLRPLRLLPRPEPIEVTAPIPDYPPMLFRYQDKLHTIVKADGPERIEQEWWLQEGQHRDYYYVEDEDGNRYWLFRLGHYHDKKYQWFMHGFFS